MTITPLSGTNVVKRPPGIQMGVPLGLKEERSEVNSRTVANQCPNRFQLLRPGVFFAPGLKTTDHGFTYRVMLEILREAVFL